MECNRCHARVGKPQATAGIFTILPGGLIAAIVLGIGAGHFSHALNIWVVIMLGCFAALPLWAFFAWLLWESPRWITFLRHGFKNCPHCGARDWKKPHYSGFGL